jgi:hypothetical protein
MTDARKEFHGLIAEVTKFVGDRPLDADLQAALQERFPATGLTFTGIRDACLTGAREGWACEREAGGIRYGRVFAPASELAEFSVDVVDMKDVVGPDHRHPKGEIDMVMPIDETALFDGHGAGWLVYGPESEHPPTVTGGRALVLYLLPDGAIEFLRRR